MKAVIILISLFFFFQISLCNTAYRKASILKSFNDFILEKLKSIESSKLIETLSFLAKLSPNENKLDAFTPVFKEYLEIEKEAKERNESMFSYIMVIYI